MNENKANSNHTHTKSDIGLGNVDNTADSGKNVKYATSAGSATNATNASNAGTTTINGTWKKVEYGNGHGYITGFQGYTRQAITTLYQGNCYLANMSATIPASCRVSNKSMKSVMATVYGTGCFVGVQLKSVDLENGGIAFYASHPSSATNLAFYVQFMFEF